MEIYDLKKNQILSIVNALEDSISTTNDNIIMYHHYENIILVYFCKFNQNAGWKHDRKIRVDRKWRAKNKEVSITFKCIDEEEMSLFRQWTMTDFSYEFYTEVIEKSVLFLPF